MKKEMSVLRQLAEEGKITGHDAGKMILAMDEAERKSVWEEEGRFDPRRFMAKLQDSYSQTMLNDIVWLERSKYSKELKDELRNLTGSKREELLERIESLSPADPAQFAENPLMLNIDYLRKQGALDALSVMAAFKRLEDFSGCSALEGFDLDRSKEILRESAQQKVAIEEFRLSLPMRRGDSVRLHGPNSVEIHQADGKDLEVIGEKIYWADTEDEARKVVEDVDIWTFLEGDRVWIRDSRVHNLLGWPLINLKLFVPREAGVDNSPCPPGVAGFCDSVRVKDVEAGVRVSTAHLFSAENVTRELWVNARSGDVSIINLDGKAEVEALCGDISVENSRADLEIRSVLGDVTCTSLSGSCKAKLIQGSLTMTDTCTSNLDISTKDGRIVFERVVMGGMSYEIKSESGDIEVSLDNRSDCGLMAESGNGSVTCPLPEDEKHRSMRTGPNSIYLNVRRGSGGMHIVSESGNITIKVGEKENT